MVAFSKEIAFIKKKISVHSGGEDFEWKPVPIGMKIISGSLEQDKAKALIRICNTAFGLKIGDRFPHVFWPVISQLTKKHKVVVCVMGLREFFWYEIDGDQGGGGGHGLDPFKTKPMTGRY